MCSYLYLLRSRVLWSALPIVKHANQTVQKKNDVELPPLPPKVYKNPRYYQFRNNIRIQHELTTKKSKRNCDTKQQTEALSQPLSFCQKIWWSTCVKLKKRKEKISYSSLIVWQISALARVTWLYYVCAKGGGRCVQNQRKYMRPPLIARNLACA